ncbi:MAG TPA: transglutaminase family protein [Chitinophagaceae bacterium]|jgi:regulator of sirC expression with transglutaminase-like and TPR domain|nr:transglutaminase family protein [Chitinophagaceae bacterium]
METNKELTALLTLLDDPDEEVFGAVSERIIDYGKNVIPNLEHLWETSPDENMQERIELLIHRLHYRDLSEDFRQWSVSGHHDLLLGAMLTCKFQYPDMSSTPVLQEIEKIRRNIWLELNNYLTPLEQVNIVTSILYSYYSLKGNEINYQEPNDFLLHKVLEAKRGNQLGNGILYMILCEMLDIPVKAVNIPQQFILAYLKPGYSDENLANPLNKVEFFIDPASGQVFTYKEVENYFNRIAVPPVGAYFKPLPNKKIISHLLNEFSKCFAEDKEMYKQQEILSLASLLD